MILDWARERMNAAQFRIFILLLSLGTFSAAVWLYSVGSFLVAAHHHTGFQLGYDFPAFQDIAIYASRFTLLHTDAFFQIRPGYSAFAYPPLDAPIYQFFYRFSSPVTAYLTVIGLWMVVFCGVLARMLRGYVSSTRTRLLATAAFVCFSFPVVFLAERANVELFVWILVSVGVVLYMRKAPVSAAVCLGLAASLKLYPVLLLGLFVSRRREWKAGAVGVLTFVASTFLALVYAGPSIGEAFRGFLLGILVFKNANGETSRRVEMLFDHSLFSPLKLFGLFGQVLPRHWADMYYIVAGAVFLGLFLLGVRSKPFLNRLMFLTVAMVALPPVSYEYTLVHLYLPLTLLVIALLHEAKQSPGTFNRANLVALGCALLLTVPFALLKRGTFIYGGQVQVVALLSLATIAAFRSWEYMPDMGSLVVLPRPAWSRRDLLTAAAGITVDPAPADVAPRRPRAYGASLLLAGLTVAGEWVEARTWFCVLLMLACYVPVVLLQARTKLLINDELYTVHIAQQPTVGKMLWLAREIDLHPPLHYFFQRWALHLPAPRWFDSRLPSMLAGWAVTIGVFRFTQRRMGNLFGLLAACVFWFTPALDFAWMNRPYELWLGFLAMLLVARDVAHQPERPKWAVPLVFFLTLCMVATHLLGIACLAIAVLAEWWRSRRTGRLDWPVIAALLLPALLGLGFYYQFHHLSQNAFPEAQQPSWFLLTMMYIALFGNAAAIIGGCVLGFAMFFGARAPERQADIDTLRLSRRFTSDDLLLLVLLLVLPVGLFVPALLLNLQFWFRYAGASMPAMAMLAAWFVARKLPLPRALATMVILCAVSYMAYVAVIDTPPQTNALEQQGGRWPVSLASLPATMPIVAASPMTFIEMADREPAAIARRTYYLTDRQSAYDFAHYTLFENEDKIRGLLNLPTKTEDFHSFLREHPRFYVVGDYNRPEIWLLRKLDADGNQVNYLGKFVSSYETEDLYMVTVKDTLPLQGEKLRQSRNSLPRREGNLHRGNLQR